MKTYTAYVSRVLYNRKKDLESTVEGTFNISSKNGEKALLLAEAIFFGKDGHEIMQTVDARIKWDRQTKKNESYRDFSFELHHVMEE